MDVDTGVDDALALVLAVRAPQLDLRAVTCVAGNGPIDTVVDATLRVLEAAGAAPELPVGAGFDRPLVEPVHFAPVIHGEDCLGDLTPKLPTPTRVACGKHATQLIIETLERLGKSEKLTIIALAPLTNLAVAIRLRPDLFRSNVEKIVWMGGAVMRGGNYRPWAEANAAYDPEATHIVLSSGVPLMMYPWDAYLDVEFSRAELELLGAQDPSEGACTHGGPELCARLLHREMRNWRKETAGLGDAGAVLCMMYPEVCEMRHLPVSVELTGTRTRGMTVVDLRTFADPPDEPMGQPNVHIVMEVNPLLMKQYFAEIVFSGKPV